MALQQYSDFCRWSALTHDHGIGIHQHCKVSWIDIVIALVVMLAD